jgi:hypothetical protein
MIKLSADGVYPHWHIQILQRDIFKRGSSGLRDQEAVVIDRETSIMLAIAPSIGVLASASYSLLNVHQLR